ncbi:MAG: ABC transporter ATP-binding protein [Deltaproteobacteria bacterium]|nr:ABC transporter ATP-binding protein [Deltaproteobacteria bacterium]MBW1918807.1 ABC transporter ATP-binding protein [Deltaproteobacteria bacterium]MBW1935167.1 ABC transporter ATP-binding protein [Deltaproteobacteria bacterium]MBW1977393.1 ABC transporter ATP-binding protein [Deltaproteobacteria bacterium]MBW2044047.1 ABC transporter ATP-binding protein [Deltaproteobacteria bacterium]
MLRVENLYKSFGGIMALCDVSFRVEPKTITGLIGPNGSGKSTLFNVISGFYKKDKGDIYFEGQKIEALQPFSIALMGIGRTFQISEAPQKMTVMENLLLAPKDQIGEKIVNVFLHPSKIREQNEKDLQKAYEILKLVQLHDLRNEYSGNLSGGQKKLLSLGRILMFDPSLLLLDEPTAGVNPTLIKDLVIAIKKLRDEREKTILLVEHNMKVISEICDKVIVLNFGKKIAEGTPEEIQENEAVLEAYLSGSARQRGANGNS